MAVEQLEMWSQVPTTTAHQSRLQVFQPSRRPTLAKRVITTPWGTATITGRLGQTHADLIEAACRNAEDWKRDDDGRLHLLVDPHRIRKSMGGGDGRYPLNRIWSLIHDIEASVIDLNAPSLDTRIMGGIIDLVEESPMTRIAHNGTKRQMWRVVLAKTFVLLLEDDLPLHYDPAPIAKIKTGFVQAVVRHMMTHSGQPNGGWTVDTLVELVGAKGSPTDVRNRRRELYEAAEELEPLGILVDRDSGRVFKT